MARLLRTAVWLTPLLAISTVASIQAGELYVNYSDYYTTHNERQLVDGAEYKPLTTWSSLWLATAYYTNPDKVLTYDYAWGYEPKQIEPSQFNTVYKLAKDGIVMFGIPNREGAVVPTATDTLALAVSSNSPVELIENLEFSGSIILAPGRATLGPTFTQTFVTQSK